MPKLPEGFAPQPAEGFDHELDSDQPLVTCDNCGSEVTATVAGLCPVCQAETEETS